MARPAAVRTTRLAYAGGYRATVSSVVKKGKITRMDADAPIGDDRPGTAGSHSILSTPPAPANRFVPDATWRFIVGSHDARNT